MLSFQEELNLLYLTWIVNCDKQWGGGWTEDETAPRLGLPVPGGHYVQPAHQPRPLAARGLGNAPDVIAPLFY